MAVMTLYDLHEVSYTFRIRVGRHDSKTLLVFLLTFMFHLFIIPYIFKVFLYNHETQACMICISDRYHVIVVPCPGNHFITFSELCSYKQAKTKWFLGITLFSFFIKHTTIQSVYQSFDTTLIALGLFATMKQMF